MDADAKRTGGVGIGSIRTPADNGREGSKIGKILRTSFMDGPLYGCLCYNANHYQLHFSIFVANDDTFYK